MGPCTPGAAPVSLLDIEMSLGGGTTQVWDAENMMGKETHPFTEGTRNQPKGLQSRRRSCLSPTRDSSRLLCLRAA